jgi:hypothetical protein
MGSGGMPSTGGMMGTGGRIGTGGGMPGTGGAAGAGGKAGAGGSVGGGGMPGTGGVAGAPATGGTAGGAGGQGGMSGAGGVSGTGGAVAQTGPCAGLCASPITVQPRTSSGDLGAGATCHEVISAVVIGVNCGNFASGRTLTVNSTLISNCVMQSSNHSLPNARNGGYCMQATAGLQTFAYFTTY